MMKPNKKLMSLAVAAMYALCILVTAPVQAYATTGTHATSSYSKTTKAKQTSKALKALAKLPYSTGYAKYYDSTAEYASLKTLYNTANNEVYRAKNMGLKYKSFKNYKRLGIAKTRINQIVAILKTISPTVGLIEKLPTTITLANETEVLAAQTAYNKLSAAQKKLTPNQTKLLAAVATIKSLNSPADVAAAKVVSDLITALPTTITPANSAVVIAARSAYTALTPSQKMLVNNLATLVAAEAKIGDVKTVSVASVAPSSSKTIKVVFVGTPDPSKIAIAVTRGAAPLTATTSWNDSKTEATVTAASNFAEGEYTVAVKNGTTDLGTTKVNFTQQKVSKINILSTKLAVAGVYGSTTTPQFGYATYNVTDQYGIDITSSYLANNITFQSGLGTVAAKNGVLVITPTINLIQFTTTTITGFETLNGTSTSASLTISSVPGTLSDISLTALTNSENKQLTAGDTTSVYYVTYVATDVSGNPTKDYNLVKGGLILSGTGLDELSVSNSYVKAKIVKDPLDSAKAAIQVSVTSSETITTDLPVTITAMSYSGKSSSLALTLKKAAGLDTFTLMAPSYDIAIGELKEIPFVAYDQYGIQIKKFSELDGKVTLNGGLKFEKNIDGTAKLMLQANSVKGSQFLSAVTTMGKTSSITINIQEVVKADALTVDSSVVTTAMQNSATQVVDFYDKGGLSVTDQYGRVIDMITADATNKYKVTTTSSDGTKVTASGFASAGKNAITISAVAPGTATITFNLINTDAPTVILDSKAITFSVLLNDDIKDYTIDTVKDPIFTSADSGTSAITERDLGYEANPYVYGKTSSGAKVILNGTTAKITGAYVSNSTDFYVKNTSAYDSVEVVARKPLDATKTTATTGLTVTLIGTDNMVHSVNTNITSTTVSPVAKDILISAATQNPGVSISGDTVTFSSIVNSSIFDNDDLLGTGRYLTRVKNDDGVAVTRAATYLYALDQYGSKSMKLAQIRKAGTSTVSDFGFSINANGMITVNKTGLGNGQFADVTGVTSNGLIKTVRLLFNTAINATDAANASVAPAIVGASIADATTAVNNGHGLITLPAAGVGNTFRYLNQAGAFTTTVAGFDASAFTAVANGDNLTIGANATAANGRHIGVAEVNASNLVVKFVDITVAGIADYTAATAGKVTGNVTYANIAAFNTALGDCSTTNKVLVLTVDGTAKTITFDGNYATTGFANWAAVKSFVEGATMLNGTATFTGADAAGLVFTSTTTGASSTVVKTTDLSTLLGAAPVAVTGTAAQH